MNFRKDALKDSDVRPHKTFQALVLLRLVLPHKVAGQIKVNKAFKTLEDSVDSMPDKVLEKDNKTKATNPVQMNDMFQVWN